MHNHNKVARRVNSESMIKIQPAYRSEGIHRTKNRNISITIIQPSRRLRFAQERQAHVEPTQAQPSLPRWRRARCHWSAPEAGEHGRTQRRAMAHTEYGRPRE